VINMPRLVDSYDISRPQLLLFLRLPCQCVRADTDSEGKPIGHSVKHRCAPSVLPFFPCPFVLFPSLALYFAASFPGFLERIFSVCW